MTQLKKILTAGTVLLLLIGSVLFNILDARNPNTTFLQQNSTPAAEKTLTKTTMLEEKLTLPLNDTTVEIKISRAETSIITVRDELTGLTSNQIYFQVFSTVKNIGTKPFSFSSIPVFGISKNNFILLAKNVVSNGENKIVIGSNGISPNQNSNLMRSSLEIKPGSESTGFFLFENEVQTIQILASNTPYIWQTMKPGADIVGKEILSSTEISNTSKNVRFKIISSNTETINNRNLSILRISFTNTSNDEISPFSFVPKYGTSIPGEVYKNETINPELSQKYNCEILIPSTRLGTNQTKEYLIAFPQNVSFLFLQPPMIEIFSNEKIIIQ